MESRLYLILDLLVFLGPLTRAFEPRIFYIGKWKRLLAATMAVWVLFLPWDAWFTAQGVWGFSAPYLVGWDFFGLPLEEVLFFVVVPWASYFIYEVLQLFFPWGPNALMGIPTGSGVGDGMHCRRHEPSPTGLYLLDLSLARGRVGFDVCLETLVAGCLFPELCRGPGSFLFG